MKVTENRYSGIPTIRREMKEYNLPEPEFLDQRGNFIVKLYKNSPENIHADTANNINDRLLVFCKTPRTRSEITEFLGLSSTQYAIKTYVMPLVKNGIIKLTIPDKPKSQNQKYYS